MRKLNIILTLTAIILLLQLVMSAPLPATISESNDVHRLTNQERSRRGLNQLRYNSKLERSACVKAKDMLHGNYWSHQPKDKDMWFSFKEVGYSFKRAGENLAYGYGDDQQLFNAWLDSESHKDNIMGDYSEHGVCKITTEFLGETRPLIVHHFAKP